MKVNFYKLLKITAVFLLFSQFAFSQVGINTTTPISMLDINGNLSVKVVIINGSSTAQNISDGIYISLNPSATDQEFKLPDAREVPGRIYYIRNISPSTAKLTTVYGKLYTRFDATTGGNFGIYMYTNGSSDVNTVLRNSWRNITVVSDGSNWTVF